MAPSPTIPTSFVPKQPVKSAARFTKSGGNMFLGFSLLALILSVVLAVGVFGYEKYLEGVQSAKAAELARAEQEVNSGEVEQFIRTRDRFKAARDMLDRHVALSNFLDLLESITLVNVRYSSFDFEILEDKTGEIRLSGTASSFNALAAQSAVFSSDTRIRRAIFSGIDVDEKGTVSFSIDAHIAPELLTFTVDEAAAKPSSAQKTASTTPSASSTAPVAPVTPPRP